MQYIIVITAEVLRGALCGSEWLMEDRPDGTCCHQSNSRSDSSSNNSSTNTAAVGVVKGVVRPLFSFRNDYIALQVLVQQNAVALGIT